VRAFALAVWLGAVGALALTSCDGREVKAPTSRPADSTPAELAPVETAISESSASQRSTAEPPPPAASAAVVTGPPRAIDMHVDTPWQVRFKGRDVALREGQGAIGALVEGGYGGVVYPIYISDKLHGGKPTIKDAELILKTIDAILKRHEKVLWDDAKGPTPDGKITAYIAIEGAGAFAEDVTRIDGFIDRGAIFIGPVHWRDNRFATSATDKGKAKSGLTDLGKTFCERIYDKGGLVDVSHMSDRSFADTVPIAKKFGAPIVATHSNARAKADHPRNLTDEQLAIIGETGGVAGLNFYDDYVKIDGPAHLSDLVDHALHMIAVAGVDHVGIGSDFDGGDPVPELADAGKVRALARALAEKGLSERDIHKIFSENVRRVMQWSKARRKKPTEG
jgi:membrane dipeptidase